MPIDHKDWVDYLGTEEEMAHTIIDLSNENEVLRKAILFRDPTFDFQLMRWSDEFCGKIIGRDK